MLTLPNYDGKLERYNLSGEPLVARAPTVPLTRTAFAAAHVVSDPLRERNPWDTRPAVDWDATLAFRTSLWDQGLGLAEAMDTAQRGMGVDWLTANGAALCVCDQGEGIAADDIPRLTERFFRVNRGRGRDTGGVGLGLAIVKHALARHDATLSVESELGVGSKFRCHFPMERIVSSPVVIAEASGGASSHF